jgi:Flp pilus assembly protein TadD
VASAPITITVEPSASDATRDIDAARVADSSRFYFRVRRFDDALRTAQSLVQAMPGNAEYHILLGDALNGLRRNDDAYNEYREALLLSSREEHHGHHDAPEYLFMRMTEMRNRIAEAQPAKK